MAHEDLNKIKEFLKRAVQLEGIIYTCDHTELALQNKLDAIDAESREVTAYKDGDLIPYENGIIRENRVYTKNTWFGTRYYSDYDQMSADYKRFHTINDMRTGYSCPKAPDMRKSTGKYISTVIGGIVGGAVAGAVPAGIIGVVYGLYYGIRYGYGYPLTEMPIAMIKTALGVAVLFGVIAGVLALFAEIKRDPNAPDKGYESEREIYLNKLKERNDKLAADHSLMQYCQVHFPELDAMRERAKRDLAEHYANSPIFAKYHNFVAVAQMLEYFESGRCDTLTGSGGAYNLFENELRQDVIIAHLENIDRTLEQIRDTQYLIYCQMARTNELLGAIDYDLQNLQYSVDANTSAIHAYGAQISAQLNWVRA